MSLSVAPVPSTLAVYWVGCVGCIYLFTNFRCIFVLYEVFSVLVFPFLY